MLTKMIPCWDIYYYTHKEIELTWGRECWRKEKKERRILKSDK